MGSSLDNDFSLELWNHIFRFHCEDFLLSQRNPMRLRNIHPNHEYHIKQPAFVLTLLRILGLHPNNIWTWQTALENSGACDVYMRITRDSTLPELLPLSKQHGHRLVALDINVIALSDLLEIFKISDIFIRMKFLFIGYEECDVDISKGNYLLGSKLRLEGLSIHTPGGNWENLVAPQILSELKIFQLCLRGPRSEETQLILVDLYPILSASSKLGILDLESDRAAEQNFLTHPPSTSKLMPILLSCLIYIKLHHFSLSTAQTFLSSLNMEKLETMEIHFNAHPSAAEHVPSSQDTRNLPSLRNLTLWIEGPTQSRILSSMQVPKLECLRIKNFKELSHVERFSLRVGSALKKLYIEGNVDVISTCLSSLRHCSSIHTLSLTFKGTGQRNQSPNLDQLTSVKDLTLVRLTETDKGAIDPFIAAMPNVTKLMLMGHTMPKLDVLFQPRHFPKLEKLRISSAGLWTPLKIDGNDCKMLLAFLEDRKNSFHPLEEITFFAVMKDKTRVLFENLAGRVTRSHWKDKIHRSRNKVRKTANTQKI